MTPVHSGHRRGGVLGIMDITGWRCLMDGYFGRFGILLPNTNRQQTLRNHISLTSCPNASTSCQSVNSLTVVGSVGPFVMNMINRMMLRSSQPYIG